MRLFADDTSLTVLDISIDELLLQIHLELPSIYNWLYSNKLTLNLKKKKTSTLSLNPNRKLTIIYYHHYQYWQISA